MLAGPPPQYTRRREGADRRVGRPRARARVEARQSPQLDELHAAPGNPGIAALGQCHPVRAEDGEGLLSLCRELDDRPRRRRAGGAARRRRRRHAAPRRHRRRSARAGRRRGSKGSKTFAKDVLDAAGVPTAERLAGRATALRRQGRRARGRQGRLRLPHPGGARRRARSGRRAGRRAPDRGAARGRGGLAVRAQRRRGGASLSLRRRTSSASATATPARTPAAWAAYSPVAGSRRAGGRRAARDRAPPGARRARPPRRAVHRPALRGPDADRRRAAGARVQLPLRRSRDAGDPAARSTATCLPLLLGAATGELSGERGRTATTRR